MLAYSGIRWGEAIGLRVKHLNFLRLRFHVRENAVHFDGTIHVGEPKSWGRRTVPFPAFLTKALETLVDGKGPHARVLERRWRAPAAARTSSTSGSWFVAALRRAEIPLAHVA
ncbi:hypothetical protein ACTJKK_02320 [Microbacterium sp. 22179]|uniref:hypothetical protein n=1 Tax=Microbacterium sp. 22179 TaxID=3453886 RepID=UPI003F85841C